jgi:hypothetical protein
MSFVKFDLPVKSDEFARRLLKEEDVLVIPGSRFGVEDHFRFSSALLEDHLKAGLSRFNSLVERILAGIVNWTPAMIITEPSTGMQSEWNKGLARS